MSGWRRVCWALIFTACYSRHCFVWLTFNQTTETVIDGFEASWAFFGGVFRVVIPDNMSSVVTKADRIEPRLNQAFVEYAQARGFVRGFVIDAARVRTPTDKPRVERTVPFVRNSLLAGETFIDVEDAQRRAVQWCAEQAGRRIHGTHACRPVELFDLEEKPRLLAAPAGRYDLPVYATAKVHHDHHIEIGRALYSIPGNLIAPTSRCAPTENWSGSSIGADWSKAIPAKLRAGGSPTPRTCPPRTWRILVHGSGVSNTALA